MKFSGGLFSLVYGVFGKLRLTLFSLGRKMSNIIHGNPPSCGQIVVRASGGGWGGGGVPCSLVPLFPTKFSLCCRVP